MSRESWFQNIMILVESKGSEARNVSGIIPGAKRRGIGSLANSQGIILTDRFYNGDEKIPRMQGVDRQGILKDFLNRLFATGEIGHCN
ncbi:MAG: hypothetical protein CVU62_00440 [Deltaproteobacteria bacterium HGW-Deltaproteobacteria-2]|jgi:hypothetical protein|nr:MAG: hypothetical protein CVU62_00440 [Deltaproteobacteria bacterium HGW-Deltaproteobacteria-2]